MDKMKFETPDLATENIDKIAALFPNCVTEGPDGHGGLKKAVDFDKLRQMLSGDVLEGDEAYEFTWVGKKAAMVEANKPTRQTLRPCPEESKNWDTTENLYIQGDNLQVLKLLQESYLGKVKMIYIDPPYNTGHDFIYNDHFEMDKDEYEQQTSMFDEEGNRNFTENTDSNPRFHSDWCSMMYSRLMLARNLLAEDGIMFISIGEEEIESLYSICDEVFGKSRHIGTFIWKRRQMVDSRSKSGVSEDHEYMLCFAKESCQRIRGANTDMSKYANPDNDARGLWMSADMTGLATASQRPNLHYNIVNPETGIEYECPPLGWRYDRKRMNELIRNKEIIWPTGKEGRPRRKKFVKDLQNQYTGFSTVLQTVFNTQGTRELKMLFDGEDFFDFPKPTDLLKMMIQQGTDSDSLVLDFFSGSATTAHAVMQLNAEDGGHRKFIMVQLPEACDEKSEAYKAGYKTICDIGKERIRRAGAKIQKSLQENGGNIRHLAQNQNPPTSTYTSPDGQMQFDVPTIPPRWSKADESDDNQKMADALDTGFRVFKLADSNMQDVYFAPNDYNQDMLSMMESNIKPDRTALDLLFGCLLEWGLPLSMPYRSETIAGCTVHTYNDGDLIACFDENIPRSVVEAIARRQPLRAVFRDAGFTTSPEKINLTEVFKLLAPDTRIKVI